MTEILDRLDKLETLISTTQKTVLNIDEVCTLTGLSKSTVYKFTHEGRIPHYKQAKHLFFDRIEVEAWLKECKGFNAENTNSTASTYVTLNQKGGAK